jgi:hypothetical protein
VYELEQRDLRELLGTKYQLSLGLRHRSADQPVSFAIAENVRNVNNTPDFGFQLGWSYVPQWCSGG